jgi:tetratricopeptide (TPR) repeat protein
LASVERERVPSPRPIAAREIPLIDRVEEMNVLKEAVYGAVHGEGSLVFIHGEAGIGKTRLVRELGAYARSRGVQVLYGRCPALFRMDGVPPYILWKEVIKDYLGETTLEQLNRVIGFYPAEVAKLVPELSQKLRAFPQSLPISPEQEQNRLFEAVSQFITNISQENPLLVILDDLQWTDPSSLLLLHYLARGVHKTPLLLLGAYRSTDIDSKHPLSPVLTELKRERLPQSVSLKRMSLAEISEMIEQILEQAEIPPEFCQMVYEKTRGNPFFAEEVVESLKEEGIIYREANKWKFKEVSKIEFPESVKNVLKVRFSRLDDECQSILTLASFVGNDFTLEAMSALTGIEENKLLDLMDKMLKTGLIKEREVRGEGVCSFADILVRDVVYEEVSLLKRKKLHGVVGSALEKVYAKKIDEHSGELASHFLESGDKEKALDYFLKAGDKAAKIHANTEAISYFQSALRLLDETEDKFQEKAHVLETLGDIKRIVGEYDDCLKRWNEALLLRKQLDEKEKVAELHRRMAGVLWRDLGKTEQAEENYEKALEILKAEPERVELAALYAARASMSYFTEDVTKARSWAEKALELGKKLSAFEVVASAYVDLGLVLGAVGERKKAVENIERALKIALDNSYVDVALRAYNNLAVELPAEESERRLECYEKGLELAKRAGHLQSIGWLGIALATDYFGMGKIDKARTLAEESDALNRKTGNLFSLSNSRLMLGAFYHIWGEWNKSEQYLKEALSISLGISNTQQIANSYGFLGWSHYDRGEYVQAKECFEKMLQVEEKTGKTSEQISDYQWVAMNYIALGEIDEARTLINDLHKFAHEKENKQLIADADAAKAMLLRAENKWNESIEFFEKSLQEYEVLGARQWNLFWLVKNVLYPYGRVYLERDQSGDREKARDLLNQALEIFQKLDAKRDVEKTASLLKTLDTIPTQTSEKAVSTESIEHGDVRSKIIVTPGELRIGESLELEIEVTNTCKDKSILLTKIMEVIPEGFVITKKPESYRREGDCLNMKDKRLGPSETEEVKLVLTPRIQGTFHIKPKIVYLDENGKESSSEPEPVTITVRELGIKGWLKGER